MLEAQNIHANYGDLLVLKDVSFQVNKGQIVSLIGANCAGKTTIVNVISGLHRKFSGKILFEGEDINSVTPFNRVKRGIIQVPEGRKVFVSMSVLDNLEVASMNSAASTNYKKNLNFVFDLFPRLKERSKQLAGTLSGGEQQMLAIGRGLMAEPNLLILDEPSLGLAPIIVKEIFTLIKKLNEEKSMSILLVEQNVRQSLMVSHVAYIIEGGKIVYGDTANNILQNQEMTNLYMGLSK